MGFWIVLAINVALTVLGAVLAPRPKIDKPKPSSLGDFDVPTADATRAIPVIFGTVLTRGPNVVWYGDLRSVPITQTVKTGLFTSSEQILGYKYFLGMQLVLCHGPVDVFRGIRFDDKIPVVTTATVGDRLQIDLGNANNPILFFNNPNRSLFGGTFGQGGVGGLVDFHYGGSSQAANDYLAAKITADIPAYRTVCYAVLRNCYLGTSPSIKNVAFELSRYPNTLGLTGGKHIIATYDANPACVLYDILTDPVAGLNVSSGLIDIASFQAVGDTLYTEGFGLSLQYDTQQQAKDVYEEILRHIDAIVDKDTTTGKLKLVLIRKDYNPATIAVLDESNVSDVELSRPAWPEITNTVRIGYISRADNYTKRFAPWQNLAAIQIAGERITAEIDFLGISQAAVANAVAARTGKTISYPLARVTVRTNRSAWALRPGGVFKLNWSPLGISGLICRVLHPDYGQLEEGQITLECVEDIFAIASTGYSPPAASSWVDPVSDPAAATAQVLLEGPYHLIDGPNRYVLTAAVRASGATLGYEIHSDPTGGTTYQKTGQAPGFTPSGLLNASYAAGTAALDTTGFVVNTPVDLEQLATATQVDFESGVNLCLIDKEILAFKTVTDNGDGTWTISNVLRGVLDTVPEAHSSSARVYFLLPGGVAVVQPSAPYTADGNVRVKLLPYNARKVLDIASATGLLITTASRAQKPYPPGNVKIAGVAWPTSVTGGVDIAVTWNHRHRVTQTNDQKLVAQDAGNYAAAPEGDYTVEVRVLGFLHRTVSAIAGTTWTWTIAMQAADSATVGASVSIRVIPKNGALSGTYQERLFTIA